ncbi:MAG TPA: redoxin domain-containing protein [Bryobacteraceae bacterium]|nr:redoxin domain-containing protein [Bryobacteraceae bacterium]
MRSALSIGLMLSAGILFAQEFKVGSKVADFQVQDLDGKAVAFSALRGPVTVVTFISTQCPVSNGYNQRMNSLFNDYSSKNVKFIFVNANQNERADEVRRHAKQVGFVFPVYKDANNVVADRFGAEVTPENYVIDSSGVLRYHGSIDDSQNEARIRTRGLRLALDAVLAGKPVEITETKAFGCSIKRVRKRT